MNNYKKNSHDPSKNLSQPHINHLVILTLKPFPNYFTCHNDFVWSAYKKMYEITFYSN